MELEMENAQPRPP